MNATTVKEWRNDPAERETLCRQVAVLIEHKGFARPHWRGDTLSLWRPASFETDTGTMTRVAQFIGFDVTAFETPGRVLEAVREYLDRIEPYPARKRD